MSIDPNMSETRVGAWVVNCAKHLVYFDPTDPGLGSLENILFAGKCGSLLVKLSADQEDRLGLAKVQAHARVSGIARPELTVYLDALRAMNCLDWGKSGDTFQVLPFGRTRVLAVTARILLAHCSHLERKLLDLLEHCLPRPRLLEEVREFLAEDLDEQSVEHVLEAVRRFELLGISRVSTRGTDLYFNEYQFGDRIQCVDNALAHLDPRTREQLDELLDLVLRNPGVPCTGIPQQSRDALEFALATGLIEVSQVQSPAGSAGFLTMPRLVAPSVGIETTHLEDDVFHHSKVLLSSLRFGESHSSSSRGRIIYPEVLLRRLVEGEYVGPCTAIGQDYALLECEGVIRTRRAENRPGEQFYMQLRRREPAEIVLGMLEGEQGSALENRSLFGLTLPVRYSGPETTRATMARRALKNNPETMRRFLEELRT